MPEISLPITLTDGEEFRWDVQRNGHISDGSNDAYDGGLRLRDFPETDVAETEDNGREIVFAAAGINGLEVQRKVYVPEDQGWARYLEVFTNPTDSALTYTVGLDSDFGSNGSTRVVKTSDGNQNFNRDDTWIVTDDHSDGGGDPTLLHVVAGQYGEVRPADAYLHGDSMGIRYDLTLQPGETQIVMHFAAQNADQRTALNKADALANLELGATEGLTAEERGQIVTFDVETIIEGSPGPDALIGDEGRNRILGLAGDDSLEGRSGNDFLDGGDDRDQIDGGAGRDTIVGGSGSDVLTGGEDADIFVFTNVETTDGIFADVITDYDASEGDVVSAESGVAILGSELSPTGDLRLTLTGDDQVEFSGVADIAELVLVRDATDDSDSIDGTIANDSIGGLDGDDTIMALEGDDTIDGGSGDDSLSGGDGNDSLFGRGGNDELNGGGGDDTIEGGDGDDGLYGREGNDDLKGGGGNDFLSGLEGADILDGGDGRDTLLGWGDDDSLSGGGDSDSLDGGAGNDRIDGGEGADTLFGDDGDDVLRGGLGSDRDSLYGGAGADKLNGEGGDDILVGDAGADTIDGNGGDDFIQGGGGNDSLTGAEGGDAFSFTAQAAADGIEDLDVITDYDADQGDALFLSSGVVVRESVVDETNGNLLLTLTGGDRVRLDGVVNFSDVIVYTGETDFADSIVGGDGDDTLSGLEGNDTINSLAGNDVLAGDGGHDLIDGEAGDDTIDGGGRDDTLIGGEGNDVIFGGVFPQSGRNLEETEPNDTFAEREVFEATVSGITSFEVSGELASENGDVDYFAFEGLIPGLTYVAEVVAGPLDTILGLLDETGAVIDVDDDGGSGVLSNLTFNVQESGHINLAVSGYNDADFTGAHPESGGYTLRLFVPGPTNVSDNDSILGAGGNDFLFGGEGSDFISGGVDADTIDCGNGNDSAVAGSGDDIVDGGAGNDNLLGEAGNDTLDGGHGNDEINGGEGDDQLAGGEGNDGLYGRDGDDDITGGDGNDYLSGALGLDTLSGGEGRDTLVGYGDNDRLLGDGGNDTVLGGGGDDTVNGGEGDDALEGGEGNDGLYGREGNDSLKGDAGHDYLSGAWGEDTLEGGDGHDNLLGWDGNDSLFGDGGADTLMGGAGNDMVNGGEGDDKLEGGDGNDELFGREGSDSMDGNAGDDNLSGADGDDTLNGGDGRDNLLGWGGDDSLAGGAANDSLDGGGGNDTLGGGDNDDSITGAAGSDALAGGTGADLFVFGGSEASDDVRDVDVIGDFDPVEGDAVYLKNGVTVTNSEVIGGNTVLTLTGGDQVEFAGVSSPEDVTVALVGGNGPDSIEGTDENDRMLGLAGDDTITGGGGDDTLDGGSGQNVLAGGTGSDLLIGGSGADRFIIDQETGEGAPVDIIRNFHDNVDVIDLSGFDFYDLDDLAPLVEARGPDTLLRLGDAGGEDLLITGLNIFGLSADDVKIAGDEDFETGAQGWSDPKTTDGGGNLSTFLGRFGGGEGPLTEKTFNLPEGTGRVEISFDFYELDSWDNEDFVTYVNGEALFSEDFHTNQNDTASGDETETMTWSISPVTNGSSNKGFSWWNDQIHRVTIEIDNPGDSFALGFGSTLDEEIDNESFGIDNLTIDTFEAETEALLV